MTAVSGPLEGFSSETNSLGVVTEQFKAVTVTITSVVLGQPRTITLPRTTAIPQTHSMGGSTESAIGKASQPSTPLPQASTTRTSLSLSRPVTS